MPADFVYETHSSLGIITQNDGILPLSVFEIWKT